jgi:signal transduction histidine kinase
LRYSPEDSPLRVAVRPAATDVVLEIHNRGPAIPPALLAHIFDPFERGELTRGAGAGLGLGLYIVQQIVAGHGGSAEARSSEEEGTTFTLILPRTPPAPR